MSQLLRCALRHRNLEASIINAQYKFMHTSQSRCSTKDYHEIKLKPFKEQSVKGVQKFRRQLCLPHHVENIKWRLQQGLPQYLNSCGPLTDNPDYSYVDETLNRPPCYGTGQRKRILEQIELAKSIIHYTKEVDKCKEKTQEKLKAQQLERQALLESKLKPKGTETL
ncbi:hypothetical protein M8J76_015502 [Diaphorina citri]|nr:hypothetical protein M8J76_015502 [Diaphorina citri]